ncbi:hypothetical protein FC62_GL000031 [Amylolactobacillus amylotrophicus DSM 20534]|uniref:Alkaline-shock protein n=3 Tax=Amylolactobacillus TaxID=2767876 RepID=A0A1L6XAD7_9LACO|nr:MULTISPECIES: Asp23/Gls24 family envelope stress response protein [Amylolactobacillus]APT17940.1 alkaline-shock protein [Amylolactobacillus amylophilus DSM 20533 = JCM 1125]KRK38349.1 hypothetical protein FC62_GL000031 [Amylolactobacillus amylotrophicus DSM 20534]KRM43008.1 hypothetical protein FD40_GL000808 [Amylolactobacillus amylophilus DSM 20533 = JCM 1125]GED79877.1 alkaline-shock protein [Amylolactobacillus amylophilus]
MAENSTIILTNENEDNQIKIDLRVLEVILGIAATKVDGVYEMRGTLANNINKLFGRENHGKGVDLKVVDNELLADVYAYFKSGVNIPKVALELQKKLQTQLEQMTDLKLKEINIHVVGLYSIKEEEQANPGSLFSNSEEETDEQALTKEQLD